MNLGKNKPAGDEILEKLKIRENRKAPLKLPTIFTINHIGKAIDLALSSRIETEKKNLKFVLDRLAQKDICCLCNQSKSTKVDFVCTDCFDRHFIPVDEVRSLVEEKIEEISMNNFKEVYAVEVLKELLSSLSRLSTEKKEESG